MRIGVINSLRPERENCIFDRVRDMGLKTCQVSSWNSAYLSAELAAKVVSQSKASGVEPCAFWAGYCPPAKWNFTEGPTTLGLVPREYRKQRVIDLKRGADFARMIGVRAIITHCGFIPENMTDPEYQPVIDAIGEVAAYCKERGVEFWFETGQETPVVLLRVIEDVGTGNLGINLDPANLLMYGKGSPCDALEVFGKYVRNLHVKDGMTPTNGRELGREVQVGKGMVNFPRLIPRLRELGFDGEFIIEREIREGEEQKRDILETVRNLQAWWDGK
ncbi:sugar phosphate isomerase/epimerase family protein [Oligosphaera ethanolica]|uniref:Sugar phosphate isomerase/epimerase n=1 Tax=Oligosphaera ethanolica TaxID=760260 RepID=A0AAE3VHM9_9BACT|nr:sugar phosphate isomerase/epimerase family protein [Oligosphaera ethanolica]MDQ0290436.1 sugar phosphate isomerase/epimerase [Oligosphaera ethanolica]